MNHLSPTFLEMTHFPIFSSWRFNTNHLDRSFQSIGPGCFAYTYRKGVTAYNFAQPAFLKGSFADNGNTK